MDKTNSTMARQIAQAASVFEQQRTGNAPKSVTVVLSNTTLVIMLHRALSRTEMALAKSPEGTAQVQDFYRQLFANVSASLRQEIKRITGVEVREATADIGVITGAVPERVPTGTVVQVFLLAYSMPASAWSGKCMIEETRTRLMHWGNGCWTKAPKLRVTVGLLLVIGFGMQYRQLSAGKGPQSETPVSKFSPSAAYAMIENPAPIGDPHDLMVRSDPLGLLRIAQERYNRTVRDYVCTFSKEELVGSQLTAEQVTSVKFREKPFSVNMLWVKNANKARRAIYVEGKWTGKNGEKLSVVEPAGAIARIFVDNVLRPIDGPDAKKASRRRIDQFGFANSLRLIIQYCDLSAKHDELDLKYVGDGVVGERPTYVIERRLAYTGKDGVYPDQLLIVDLDKETLLPLCCVSYADEAKTKLLGRYVLTDVKFNVGLTDGDFARKGE